MQIMPNFAARKLRGAPTFVLAENKPLSPSEPGNAGVENNFLFFNIMIKRMLICSCIGVAVSVNAAEPQVNDSLKLRELQEVQVRSTRATSRTPMAVTNMSREDIRKVNFGKDIPFLLSLTPSALTSSDAGIGIGYTALRIRGTDATRINVTANGIPLNDAESNGLYWVNMPDFASSLGSIQIQRGVGTSTNGSGAFGATVNLQTEKLSPEPYFRLDASGGSYGSHKESLLFGSGMLHDHWVLSGRLSEIGTDGYIDRASVRLGSYFLQAAYLSERTSVKFVTFNGKEKTYHAWDYATLDDMRTYGRTYNPCGKYKKDDGSTAFYPNQTDNYHQQHYQLLWNQLFSPNLNLNVALHYTHGHGYYEQYKKDQSLYKYTLPASVGSESDLVRQKVMDNDFFGTVYSLNYRSGKFRGTIGGGWNMYDGDHYGKVLWLRNAQANWNPEHQYYDNTGRKHDMNIYVKQEYDIVSQLTGFLDLQYRFVDYRMRGPSDQYVSGSQLNYRLNQRFNFFNPKLGITWQPSDGHSLYASVAQAHKEPTRNDYEDNLTTSSLPKSERLTDFEAGYHFRQNRVEAGANLYYMLYKDQFVLTGEQNQIGEMVARNVGDSYRFGLELTGRWRPLHWLQWDANLTWSRNRSKNLKLWVDDLGEYYNLKSAPLSFSPSLTASSVVSAQWKGLNVGFQSQYVGEQYMTTTGLRSYNDNGQDVSLMLDRFFVSNLDVTYSFDKIRFVRGLNVGVTVYNLFGTKYESFGAAYTAIKSSPSGGIMGYQDANWNSYSVYSAQAPVHFMAHVSINF